MSYSVQEVLVNNQDRTSGNDCDFRVELANNRTLDPSYSHVAVSQVATKGVVYNISESNNRLYFTVNVQALKKSLDPNDTSPYEKVTVTRQGVTRTAENNFTTYVTIPPGSYTPTTLVSTINTLEFPASEEYTNFNLNAPTLTIGSEQVPFFGFYNGVGSKSSYPDTIYVYSSGILIRSFSPLIPNQKPNFRPFAAYDSATQKFTFSIVYDGTLTPSSSVQGTSVSKNQFVISEWIAAHWGEGLTDEDNSHFLYVGNTSNKIVMTLLGEYTPWTTSQKIQAIQDGALQNIRVVATVIPFFDSNEGSFPALLNLNSDVGFTGSTNFYEGVTYNGGVSTNDIDLDYETVDTGGLIGNMVFSTSSTPSTQSVFSSFSSVFGKGLTYDDSQFYDSYTASFAAITLFKTGLSWVLCSNLPRVPIMSTNLNLVQGMCLIPCNNSGEYTLTEFVYDHDHEIDPGILKEFSFQVCDLEGNKLDFKGEISILLRFKKLTSTSSGVKRQRIF